MKKAPAYNIVKITSRDDLDVCADYMISSNPWNVLYFSKEQCIADLLNEELDIYAARTGNGEILGFLAAMAHGIGFEPMIEYLCISAQYRSLGIGTNLIEFFENELFPEADNLYLFVSDINPDAIRLYVRLGYLQIGAMPNFNLFKQTEFLHRKFRRPRQARFIPS